MLNVWVGPEGVPAKPLTKDRVLVFHAGYREMPIPLTNQMVAARVLDLRALAVTADSESLADEQRTLAAAVARDFGLSHRFIRTRELEDPAYARNDRDRCYFCKAELFRHLLPLAEAEGLAHVAYGLIADDLTDVRPGRRAAEEAGVRAPLAEVGMTKDDVRALSRAVGLPTWDLPASPCLASRLPYGTAVTGPQASSQAVAGPTIAPSVSIVRSRPNARRYASFVTAAASSAFRTGVRTPRPSHAHARTMRTCQAADANPIDAVPYAVTI